jgi:hypothetical protein
MMLLDKRIAARAENRETRRLDLVREHKMVSKKLWIDE